MIPQDKVEEFGVGAHKYYKIEHSFFKSKLDLEQLEILWNQYWIQTLSQSPLINVINFINICIELGVYKQEYHQLVSEVESECFLVEGQAGEAGAGKEAEGGSVGLGV